MGKELAELALSLILGLVFLRSAVGKLRQGDTFLLVVLDYRLFPLATARLVAVALPACEFGCACMLLTGTWPRPTAIAVCCQLLAFVAGISVNLRRGRAIDCGCYGTSGERRVIGWRILAEDTALLASAVALAVLASSWTGTFTWSVARLILTAGAPPWCVALPPLIVGCTVYGGMNRARKGEYAWPTRRPGVGRENRAGVLPTDGR